MALKDIIAQELGEDIAEVFMLNQLYLLPDRRIADKQRSCFDTRYLFVCTLPHQHHGLHAAHGLSGNIIFEWPQESQS